MEVTVVVGTYGERHWMRLAERRAIPSVPDGVPVIHEHDHLSLARARNAGLNQVETEFTIHLDADDELGEGYIDAMGKGTADLRVPARVDIRSGEPINKPYVPRVWGHSHDCKGECLRFGNWMVVGTCVRTALAQSVGWEEFGWSEDWAFFARCWKAGGTVQTIPEAVYRAHWTRRSRNKVPRDVGLHWHREIEKAIWPEEATTT